MSDNTDTDSCNETYSVGSRFTPDLHTPLVPKALKILDDLRIGQFNQHRLPTVDEKTAVKNIIDNVDSIIKAFKQENVAPPVRYFSLGHEAVSNRASLFELRRLIVLLGSWSSVNDSFMGWIKKHLMINSEIIRNLEIRNTRMQRAILCIRALTLAKYLRRPAINHEDATVINSRGEILQLTPMCKLFLQEMYALNKAKYTYFGSPEVLRSMYNDPSPKTVLDSLQSHDNVIFTTLAVNKNNCVTVVSNRRDASTNTMAVAPVNAAITASNQCQQSSGEKDTIRTVGRKRNSSKPDVVSTYELRHKRVKNCDDSCSSKLS
jgi:hypothetical protein